MTSSEMDAMLKTIRVDRDGDSVIITGRAIIDGKYSTFSALRRIPQETTPNKKDDDLMQCMNIWLRESDNFETKKGETK